MSDLDSFLAPTSQRDVLARICDKISAGMEVEKACVSERMGLRAYLALRRENPELQAAHEAALAQSYENEARARALNGTEEVTYTVLPSGERIPNKVVVKKDTSLLVKLLEAHDAKYRTKSLGDGAIDLAAVLGMSYEIGKRVGAAPSPKPTIDVTPDIQKKNGG